MNKKKIAINGFGRIGRLFFRQIFSDPEIEVVAINDLGDINNLAYLLQHDTVYRNFDKSVSVQDGNLVVDGQTVKILQVKDPAQLPWKDLGIDIAVEATGFFAAEKSIDPLLPIKNVNIAGEREPNTENKCRNQTHHQPAEAD